MLNDKKVILRYKDAFDFWLDGGMIWSRQNSEGSMWLRGGYPEWKVNYVYVKDDEFAELRKAMIDGKTIQFKTENCDWINYMDLTGKKCDVFSKGDVYQYRIKPEVEEPEFKVGDWVRHVPTDQVFPVSRIEGDRIYNHEEAYGNIGHVRKWEPEKGEWCLFSIDSKRKVMELAKFSRMDDHGLYELEDKTTASICMPFTGILPMHLKDK